MEDVQSILFRKDFVSCGGIFLPEELDALTLVAERLCCTLPSAHNPFSFGLGTRRFNCTDKTPQLELAVNYGRPFFRLHECREVLRMAARPMDYLAGLSNPQDYYDPNENALKNGVIVFDNQKALASIKDDGGWFVLGLEFTRALTLSSNIFAVAFLTSMVGVISAMDESNNRLRAGYSDFLSNCENWSVALPEKQLQKWLSESGFKEFASHRYEHHGPRKFFG